MVFTWIPSTQPNSEALKRLKSHFPKPDKPFPEAWFMGDVNYYDILDTEPDAISIRDLETYLEVIKSGLRSFPDLQWAVDSWKETFYYLLPHLIKRSHENYFLSDLVGCFMLIYPHIIPDIYPEYRTDILQTLGMAVMMPSFWNENDLSKEIRQRDREYWLSYGKTDFNNFISSTFYFCLKYLKPSEIETWCKSAFAISGMHWRYHLLNWLYQETFTLLITVEDENLPEKITIHPKNPIGVNTNITTITLPSKNLHVFVNVLKKHNIYYG